MKTAVVTGGSSGIGLSCCRKFLENGYRVYELSRREPKIQTVGIKHISCDVTDEHSVSETFKKIYIFLNTDIFNKNTLIFIYQHTPLIQ